MDLLGNKLVEVRSAGSDRILFGAYAHRSIYDVRVRQTGMQDETQVGS